MTEDWKDHALCAGMPDDIFFKPEGKKWTSHQAIAICMKCPVRQECLDYALEHERRHYSVFGVFGGKSADERRVMLNRKQTNLGARRRRAA